ncbi:MAG: hypothetical protein QXG00_06135 [Candidatus Woesearchaeota archaeon]
MIAKLEYLQDTNNKKQIEIWKFHEFEREFIITPKNIEESLIKGIWKVEIYEGNTLLYSKYLNFAYRTLSGITEIDNEGKEIIRINNDLHFTL